MAESTIANPNVQNEVTRREDTYESRRYTTPAVDILEKENGLVVVADLPGLTQDEIDVSVEKDVLTIKAAPRRNAEEEYAYREFEPAGYFRQFTLGSKIDQGKINAEYRHGVVTLTLPFAEEARPRQIAVNVG